MPSFETPADARQEYDKHLANHEVGVQTELIGCQERREVHFIRWQSFCSSNPAAFSPSEPRRRRAFLKALYSDRANQPTLLSVRLALMSLAGNGHIAFVTTTAAATPF